MVSAFDGIVSVLEEKFGVILFEDKNNDFSINDYISDSIMFIQFVVSLEEELHIEFPDEFLAQKLLDSAREFAQKIDDYIKSLDQNERTI